MPPTEELLQQFRNLNYLLGKFFTLAQEHPSGQLVTELNNIGTSLEKLNSSFSIYQQTITSQPWFSFVIGSLATLVATWLYESLKERRRTKDYLFNLQRVVVDQINMTWDIEQTINRFISEKLDELITRVNANTSPDIYSVDMAFLPLFSTRSMPESVNEMSSGSNYLDNKVGQIYSQSKDLPFIIEDLRAQLKETFSRNEKISFAKLNSAPVQRQQFVENIQEFKQALKRDMLEKNIPLYLKRLTEALVIVREKTNRYPITWKIIHDPRFKFYLRKASFIKAKEEIVATMDKYFVPAVEKQMKEIEELKKKALS